MQDECKQKKRAGGKEGITGKKGREQKGRYGRNGRGHEDTEEEYSLRPLPC